MTLVIERWRPDWSDPDYGTRARRLLKLHAAKPNRPLVVFLGTSRTGNGFAVDDLEPPDGSPPNAPLAFNLGLGGGGPFLSLLCLQRMLTMGIRPHSVVLEILPPSLAVEGRAMQKKEAMLMHRLRWSDLQSIERYTPALASHRYRQWIEWNALPWYSNRFRLLSRFAPSWVSEEQSRETHFWSKTLSPLGWFPQLEAVTPEHYHEGLKLAQESYFSLCRFTEVHPTTDRVLHDLLELCQREGIRVAALVRTPEGKEFRALYPPETENLIRSYLTKLASEYHTRYVDASQWMPEGSWTDSHHLLSPAAHRFTRRFWDEILQPHFDGKGGVMASNP
jgi:hypothetical protein